MAEMPNLFFYSSTTVAVLAAVFVLGYALYRLALPKPLPGIPYNKASANRLLGDIPGMLKHLREHGTVVDFFTLQGVEMNAPIYQLFLSPFSKPNVYVLDPRETQDVLMRRAKDFDRSKFFGDLFAGLVSDHHIVQPTNDKFRRGRRLLADTMGSGFLNGVAAPSLHRHTLKLMELWRVKNNLADGHAFWAAEDINCFALDSIWDTALGSQLNSVGQETEFLLQQSASGTRISLPASKDEPASLPQPEFSEDVKAMKVLTESLDQTAVSPLPRQMHWLIRLRSSYRQANAHKERLVQESLTDAKSRLLHNNNNNNDDDDDVDDDGREKGTTAEFSGITCATDHMVRREAAAAAKEGRAPEYDSRHAKDELFGFLVAGHDTTATTLMWMVKLLADHPHVQTKLRKTLSEAFAGTSLTSSSSTTQPGRGGSVPTHTQITKTSIPYLDAVLEEIVRHARTVAITARTAVHDTQLLGHRIPQGVDVFLMSNGPGYMTPGDVNEVIPEEARSVSSRESKARAIPEWERDDISVFKPERWIKVDGESGREVYDNHAGPVVSFGGGMRGCFGKKMAYMEMRILLVVLVWTYELLPAPEKLSSYAAFDALTHKPKDCYLRLRELESGKI